MFYPEDSLKRGGRFYLCWVADSWPLRFATITHRQLQSQDIRKICDNLLEVMTNESGRPAKRFSLRLSSQLLRGLVRIYQRKVTVLLGDLCMINARIIKNANKKWSESLNILKTIFFVLNTMSNVIVTFQRWVLREPLVSELVERPLHFVVQEEPEHEQRVEELIQNSGNVVANIEEITLREPTMPEIQLLVNDGFGEMSVEGVRAGGGAPPPDLSLDLSRISHRSLERTRLPSHEALMERISEHDIALFNKSIGMDLVQIDDLQKEIPEISEIPPPAPKDPPTTTKENVTKEPLRKSTSEAKKGNTQEEIVLEELQPEDVREGPRRGLLVDRRCKLDAKQFRSSLACPRVHLRCQESREDIAKIRVPAHLYFARPTQGGGGIRCNMSQRLSRLFRRNLVVSDREPFAERDVEEALSKPSAIVHTRSQLQTTGGGTEENATRVDIPVEIEGNIVNVTTTEEKMDIDVLPTQVVERLSQVQKRVSDAQSIAKRPRTMGALGFGESQRLVPEAERAQEAEKENIPANIIPTNESQKSITAMLQEVGLADVRTNKLQSTRKAASESSETPLGSLDRTKVSLGDSDRTTDSKRFIRDQWGTEGTMVKILNGLKEGVSPLNVKSLVSKGPLIPHCRSIIMARCFASLLKLKQHGFIDLRKDPKTSEIVDIRLGPKFEDLGRRDC